MSDFYSSFLGVTPTANGGLQTNSGLTLDPFVIAAQDTNAATDPLPVYPQNPIQKWITGVLVGPGINNLGGTAGVDGKPAGTTIAADIPGVPGSANLGMGTVVQGYLIVAGAVLLGVLMIVLGAWSIVKD